MTLFHQIFFQNKKFDEPSHLAVLEPYIFRKWPEVAVCLNEKKSEIFLPQENKVVEKSEVRNFSTNPPITPPKNVSKPEKEPQSWHLPKRSDNLFWSIYIGIYGFKTYQQITHHYGNIEMEEKQKIMELMKKSPGMVKTGGKKITKVLFQEIMSDFMTNKRVTMDMLLMFCIYYNKRILVINVDEKHLPDRMYMEFGEESCDPIVLYKYGKNDYSVELSEDDELKQKTVQMCSSLFKFDCYDLPLKAISNYKTEELMSMTGPLKIVWESGKKYKKPDIYAKIYETTVVFL